MESSGGEKPGATNAAEEWVPALDGEETFSEKGSVGVKQEPGTANGSRKKAPLSSFVAGNKRKRNSLNAVRVEPNEPEAARSSSGDSTWSLDSLDDHLPLSLSRKKDGQARSIGKSENSVGSGDGVAVVRQPRGVLRLKKLAQNTSVNNSTGAPNVVESGDVSQSTQLSSSKRKRKSGALKENRVSGDDPVSRLKIENGSCDQDNCWKICSEKDFSVAKQSHLSGEPSKPVYSDKKLSGHVLEDDEVSLEENAARMLCSLSDQRCPPRKRMKSPDRSLQASILWQSNHFKSSNKEVNGADGAARLLRKRDGKVSFRKRRPRRHFYEVCPSDVDPFRIVKERIRVFWPLDETWYFGLVKEYDPVTRLHHVRYDDKDEEWIDLQKERFKLLLLPSEVANRSNRNNSRSVFKPKYEEDEREDMDENSTGSSVESEPIISWLARSVNRAKSSTASNINKQSHIRSNRISALFDRKQSVFVNSSNVKMDKSCSDDTMPGSSPANGSAEVLLSRRDRRLPFVYFRKRFRKKKDGFLNISEQDSNPASTAGSITVLASVVGRASATEISSLVQLRQVTLRLSLPLKYVYKFICEAYSFSFSHTLFLLQHGTLVPLWPLVHLDIVFVDNALGLKYLLFETCLRSAISLFCLLIGTFHQCSRQCARKELKMPCTSVRFQISSLHGKSRAVFLLFSFFGMKKSNWKHLEEKLRNYRLKKELSKADCTYANIKELTNGSDQRVLTSMDLLPKGLSSDVGRSLFPPESIYSDVDPVICYLDEQCERFSRSDFHVATAPSVLLCWHLKLLIENNLTSDGFQQSMSFTSEENQSNEDSSEQVSQHTADMVQQSATASGVCSLNNNTSTDGPAATGSTSCMNHSVNSASRELNAAESTVNLRYSESNIGGANITCERFPHENGSHQGAEEPCSSNLHDLHSPHKSEERCASSMHAPRDQTSDRSDEQLFNKGEEVTQPISNLVQGLNEYPIGRATPTAPRSTWHRNRFTSISRTFGDGSRLWPEDFMLSGFASGSKKPRTQVSYSISPRVDELGSKHKGNFRKVQSHNNAKAHNAKRLPDNSRSYQTSPESLTCVVNVLLTVGDRGWREYGAQVALDSDDQNEWRICVKFSGGTRYTHKVCHILQPGATNRYTHAMMWKGGADWSLEFPDRSQWSIFKQIHEECYSRNIRAASVKNIPTPGVRLVANAHNDSDEVPFIRSSKYLGHIGTDIEMALDESHVMYDMDSDDEEWLSSWRKSLQGENNTTYEVTEDLFERVMDKFEKLAYTHNCNAFTIDQIEELTIDVGPLDIAKMIHGYWQDKRQKKGMPLIRHFQPAMWKIYQQRLQEWESAVNKVQGSSNGYQEKSLPPKPPMFAFCLKPRGLQVLYKGPKQRSHKKLMYSGYHSAFSREQDEFYRSGRRYYEFPVGEGRSYEYPDAVSSLHSPTGYSPRFSARIDYPRAFDASERCAPPRFYRTNSVKRTATFTSYEDHQPSPSFRHQKPKRSTPPDHWNTVIHEWQNSKHLFPGTFQSHRVDVEELKLRDATSAAQHAATMAKLKREKAHCLMHKADLAIHRATVALMIADAIKASERDSFRDGQKRF